MQDELIQALVSLGHYMWDGLCRVRVPGTDWSAMSLLLGILLLGFGIKLMRVLFNGLSLGGGVSAATGATRSIMNVAKK